MKTQKFAAYFVLLFVIGALVFFWQVIRQENIRKQCSDNAPLDTVQSQNLNDKNTVDQELSVLTLSDKIYTSCLHENGLEK